MQGRELVSAWVHGLSCGVLTEVAMSAVAQGLLGADGESMAQSSGVSCPMWSTC